MLTAEEKLYHERSAFKPHRSTEMFTNWIASMRVPKTAKNILDLACGSGADTVYFAKRFRGISWHGVDKDRRLIASAREKNKKNERVKFVIGDLYKLPFVKNQFDGVICLQTLSWLREYERAVGEITNYTKKWFACSSLFYEGDIDAFIKIHDYYRPVGTKDSSRYYYNVYSLPRFLKYLYSLGYKKVKYKKFKIDIDLPRKSLDLGTYTRKMADGSRVQISGPLLMPWYFIYAEK